MVDKSSNFAFNRSAGVAADGVAPARDVLKEAVDLWLDESVGLEIRYWVARELRPNSGFEDYHFALDTDFVDRIDREWRKLYLILKRPIMERVVNVANL